MGFVAPFLKKKTDKNLISGRSNLLIYPNLQRTMDETE
jgi:hypothetical protein